MTRLKKTLARPGDPPFDKSALTCFRTSKGTFAPHVCERKHWVIIVMGESPLARTYYTIIIILYRTIITIIKMQDVRYL